MPMVGMNLATYGYTYFGSEFPFIDRFRTAATDHWNAKGTDWSNLGSGAVTINAATGMPGKQASNVQFVEAAFSIDPAALPMTDRYVVTWQGDATLRFQNSTVVSQGDHRMVIEFRGTGSTEVVELRGLTDTNPIHDVHIVREDQVAAFSSGQMFNPDFLAKASQWSTLRFMDWGLTNGNQAVNWSDLASNDSVSWGTDKGVPLKVMVDLANAAGTDMWYCIPAHASDDLVRQTLTYIRDHLNPTLKLHLEYSNEVWNGGFEQAQYLDRIGRDPATWAAYPSVKADDLAGMGYYGFRSAQIAHITDEVFGAQSDARVDNVLATMTYWGGLETYIFKGIEVANLGKAGDLFEEYAITTYFGHDVGGGTDADRAKVLGWARAGTSGLDAAFQELTVGGQLSGNSSLANLKNVETYQAAVAKKYGLDLVAYEGGLHMTGFGYPDNSQEQRDIVDFMKRLLADPRMGQLYTQMANDFASVGGSELVAFNDVGEISKYGSWGALDNIYQAHSPRYDALVNIQHQSKAR